MVIFICRPLPHSMMSKTIAIAKAISSKTISTKSSISSIAKSSEAISTITSQSITS